MTTGVPAQLVGVSRRFGDVPALDAVDFQVNPGEVVALLGPNGAGKTTLVRILLGLIRADSGSARLWGLQPDLPAARRRVGVMLQVGRVPETLTVREHVHLFASYYGAPQPIDRVLEDAGVAAFADRRFGELSGGQRQRALFALAICGAPELLVMDEPTVGLDVDSRRGFWSGVRRMIDRGAAVLLTTHYIEEADAVSDRVVVLQHGRVIANARAAAIKQQVAGRKLRCVTSAPVEWLQSIRGVQSVTRDREALVVLTTDAEHLARELLAIDPTLHDLEITSAGLEEAFLALTGQARIENPKSQTANPKSSMSQSSHQSSIINLQSPMMHLRCYVLEARYELLKLMRLPAYAIPTLAFPVMFYLLFGIAMSGSRITGGRDISGYLLATYGAFGVIGAGLISFGVAVAVERAQGWLLLKRASPMPTLAYVFGKTAASMAFAAVIVGLIALCAAGLAGVHLRATQWTLLFTLLVLGAVPFCAIGLALGFMAGPNSAPAIVNLVHLPAALASGLWLPIELLPRFMRVIAPWLPQYHLGQLALMAIGMPADTRVAVHLGSLLIWTVVAVAGASWAWRRDEGKLYG